VTRRFRTDGGFEHLYDEGVTDASTATRALAARLHDIAAEHAGGLREGFTREQALAELAATTTDPDLLAEAAAAHAIADNWFAITAVGLLIEAGADRELIQAYAGVLHP
jgi:hypothetical protein